MVLKGDVHLTLVLFKIDSKSTENENENSVIRFCSQSCFTFRKQSSSSFSSCSTTPETPQVTLGVFNYIVVVVGGGVFLTRVVVDDIFQQFYTACPGGIQVGLIPNRMGSIPLVAIPISDQPPSCFF